MCRFVRSVCLASTLIATIVQAVTPDPASVASVKGVALLMVLMGNAPVVEEFDKCSAEVCQPVEHITKKLVPARWDKSLSWGTLALTPGTRPKTKHSLAIAFVTGVTSRDRDANLWLCRLVC